jgi:PAS domain S-box-containing protein
MAASQVVTSYLTVLDASPNPILAVDADGRIVYANPQVESTFGYTRAELTGQLVETLIPERFSERHPGHRTGFMLRHAARPMGVGLELAGRRRDGSEFPVEISLSPVPVEDGHWVFATVVDISARKTAEGALAESEKRFRDVLEASPNAIVAIDVTGRIRYVNPQTTATFGFSRDELLGQLVEILLPERVSTRHEGHRSAFMDRPTARPMGIGLDLAGRRADGSEFPVEISLSPVQTSDGPMVFATVVDITSRKGLERQLLQAQRMETVGRFAGGIAHDFNNMLSVVGGYSDLLAEDLATDPLPDASDLQRSVAAIRAATDRAAALTGQLMAFSRQRTMTAQVMDPRVPIVAIEPMLRRLIGEQVELVVRLDANTGNVKADAGQLDQVLVNLVVNACDALPDGGTVTVETADVELDGEYVSQHFEAAPGWYVMVAVSDNGTGMEPEIREHIFEPFFTTKEPGKGTGLGLSTVYGIVHQLGGQILVYTEPGMGSTFKIYLPRVAGSATSAAGPVIAPSIVAAGTILVVEDEEIVRAYTTRVLDRAGFTVRSARSGHDAIEVAESLAPFDVLVTDVVMPGLTGPQLAEQMLDAHPHLAVVLLSGYTEETLDVEAVLKRGAAFLSKPFAPAQLVAAIATARQLAQKRTA